MTGIDAYPLAWPLGWQRTPAHKRQSSRYRVAFAPARDHVVRELRLMDAREIVVSSNVPLRRDGLPLAGMREPEDPGVAVYWMDSAKRQRVIACDCWSGVRANMRAVGIAIESLRAIERSGASEILGRAFLGFAALPADAWQKTAAHWRDVLGYGTAPVARELIEACYRAHAQKLHPDRGGSTERMIELNRAREDALSEIAS